MLEKMNPIQAAGSIIAIILYLVAPVMSLSLIVIVYGISGQLLMKLDGYFVIPLVLMIVTLVVSMLPAGKMTSVAGIITAVANLILGLCGKSVISSKLDVLCALLGVDLGNYGAAASMAVSTFLRMGWGMIAGIIILAVAAIAGFVIGGNQSGMNSKRGKGVPHGRSSMPSYNRTGNGAHSSRNVDTSSLYRR